MTNIEQQFQLFCYRRIREGFKEPLNEAEKCVLSYKKRGYDNVAIGKIRGCTKTTIRNHVYQLQQKGYGDDLR